MPFDKDLFISYAHIDNRPLSSEMQGWISRFHESLEAILSMRLGQDALIWRDTKLQGNDIFGDEIVEQFPKTALFISVLTPRYIKSEWCTREIQEFCRIARQTCGLVIDNKSRVFKVIKTPVEAQDPLPPEVRGALGYEFYTFDENQNPLELDPAFGKDLEQAYLRKINTIAWDIVRLLKRLNGDAMHQAPPVEEGVPSKPVVYLAECSYDRLEEREILEAELKAHGYSVLPDHHLPRMEADYMAEVERLLSQCKLSIHLIGQAYGMVPGGPRQASVIVLQNELAVQQSKAGALQRVIWLPAGTRSTQEQQQQFIDAVNQQAEAQFGADVITGELEELKAAVHDTLQRLEKPEPQKQQGPALGEEHPKMIYLICDQKDRKNTIPLRKFLKAQGFKAKIPLFSGDAETVHEAEKANLATCDAVLLYYGAGDEGWKFGRENDLKKMKAYRGDHPLPVSYTYLAEPMTEDKEEMIEFEEPDLINGLDGFSETEMKAFVEAVNATKATP